MNEKHSMGSREQLWAEAMRAERQGDAVAYERLLRQVADALRGLIRHRLGRLGWSANEAEDIVQEVLIAVHTRRDQWDPGRPFMPWLNAIARYKLIDATRRMRRESRGRVELTDHEWSDMFEAPTQDEDRPAMDVERSVSGLPTAQQAVVRALGMEGQSVRDTARKLQTSEGAVRVTLHRALKRLMGKAERRRDE